jgi:hypothetical protein
MARFEPGNQIGRRWKPGQSGNPRGRPRVKPIRHALRELLNGTAADGRNYAELLVAHAFERAMARERDSLAWMRFIRDTTEGHLNTVTDDEPSIPDEKQTAGGRPGHEPE